VAGASDSPIAVAATDIATQFEAPKDLALAQLTRSQQPWQIRLRYPN